MSVRENVKFVRRAILSSNADSCEKFELVHDAIDALGASATADELECLILSAYPFNDEQFEFKQIVYAHIDELRAH